MAKVVLCQPVYGHVPPAAHIAQVELVLRGGSTGLIGICTARDTYIDWGRNHIAGLVYEMFPDFTHMLWLDGDVIPPADALERLLAAFDREELANEKAGAVGGLYFKKGPPYEAVAYDFEPDEKGQFHGTWDRTKKIDWSVESLQMVHGLGLGLTLVSREMFDAVRDATKGTCFQTTVSYGEDVWFFHWASLTGFSSWVDTSVRCKHIGDYEFSMADWDRARDE